MLCVSLLNRGSVKSVYSRGFTTDVNADEGSRNVVRNSFESSDPYVLIPLVWKSNKKKYP